MDEAGARDPLKDGTPCYQGSCNKVCDFIYDQVNLGYIRLIQVRSGQVKLDQVFQLWMRLVFVIHSKVEHPVTKDLVIRYDLKPNFHWKQTFEITARPRDSTQFLVPEKKYLDPIKS